MPRQFPPVVTRGRRLSRVDDAAEINRCESRSPSSSRVPSFNNFNRRNSSTGANNDNFNSFGGSRRGSVADMFGEQIVRRPSMHMARDVSPVKQIKIEKIEQEHTSQKQEFHTTKRIVKSEVKMDENNEDVFTEALTSLKNNNLSNIDKQVSISSTANATRGAILKTFKDLPSLNSRQNVKVSNKSIDSADKNFTETVNFCDIKAVENVTMRKEVHQEFKQETHIHQEFHEVHNKEIHTKKMINVQENHQENTTSIAENFQITGSFQNVVHGQTSEFEAMNKLQLGNNEVEPELTEVTKALSEYEEPMDFKSSFLANGTISPTKGMTNAAPIFKPEPKKERQILQQNQSEPRDVLKINKSINSTIIQSTSQNSIQSSLQQSSLGQISGKNEDLAIDFDQKVRARMSANENIKNAQVIGPDVENVSIIVFELPSGHKLISEEVRFQKTEPHSFFFLSYSPQPNNCPQNLPSGTSTHPTTTPQPS